MRLSVGVEDARDLVEDLLQAFELATHPHVEDVRFLARHGSAAALDAASSAGEAGLATAAAAGHALGSPGTAEVAAMRRQLASLSERLELSEEGRKEARRALVRERATSKRLLAGAWGVAFAASAVAVTLAAMDWGKHTA